MYNLKLKSPVSVDIEVTKKCNHSCRHCYNSFFLNKGTTTRKKLDIIVEELKNNDVWYATITGGEPLCDIDNTLYLMEQLNNNGIGIGLNSNLSLMNDTIAQMIAPYLESNSILTSLPSPYENQCDEIIGIKGGYKAICRGIECCTKNNISVAINIVATSDNIPNLFMVENLIQKYDLTAVFITRVIPVPKVINPLHSLERNNIQTIADSLVKLNEKYGVEIGSLTSLPLCLLNEDMRSAFSTSKCLAGISSCTIDSTTGNVRPCPQNENSYGNIFEDGLKKCWELLSPWRDGTYIPDECKQCPSLYLCGGECRLCYPSTRTSYGIHPISIPEANSQIDENCTLHIVDNAHIRIEGKRILIGYNSRFISVNNRVLSVIDQIADRKFTLSEMKQLMNEMEYDVLKCLVKFGYYQ